MSVPSFDFTSWRRRAGSVNSQNAFHSDDLSGRVLSPNQSIRTPHPDPKVLSSSVNSAAHREPTRSFIPGSVREPLPTIDSASYARSVREDTAELASYVLSDKSKGQRASFLNRRPSVSSYFSQDTPLPSDEALRSEEILAQGTDTIHEVSEPTSPDEFEDDDIPDEGPSILSNMIKRSPPQSIHDPSSGRLASRQSEMGIERRESRTAPRVVVEGDSENTPLLSKQKSASRSNGCPDNVDFESQRKRPGRFSDRFVTIANDAGAKFQSLAGAPKTWNRQTVWQNIVLAPLECLPAVIVGLLLNILDALSYGMILFPLSSPIFSALGPAGITIFYVSTIISQLTFSCGSIFRGAVGSELIEVVPFFHTMAGKITGIIGEDQPEAVIATTILSYALSSMLTGVVFYLMGRFKLGYILGFIPRHILLGCIGGVGWFLVATGFEVSARLDGFEYDIDTGYKLIQPDTLPLWMIPLFLGAVLFILQKHISSKYLVPVYILAIPFIFYFFVFALDQLDPDDLRSKGWIFEAPRAGEPWWYFWTLYRFDLVHWGALLECVPAMFALTFFSLLHVPINIPALAQSLGEDNANLDREMKLHGCSNFLSGLAGSIQNYLVYANTTMFMRSGGDSRLAGFMLAAFTFGVMLIGPVIIGYIPVLMVATLIFDLGFELLQDALGPTRRKLKLLEYLTIIIIILVMGIYDFVVGIFVGIVLAFISVIVHASRVSAIRAIYTGDKVPSMVRRNPSQQQYLQEVGQQTYIVKLSGFLFFGTVVSVDAQIRALLRDDVFAEHPIRFVILDMWHVTGVDYSAGEALNTISRLLHRKGVVLLISGKDAESHIGLDLRAVGLGGDAIEVRFMPDLNSALECCENEQLRTFYARQEALRVSRPAPSKTIDVPSTGTLTQSWDVLSHSPRRNHLQQAARTVLDQQEHRRSTRWRGISEPLRLMLQIFHNLSDKNEDFWFRAKPYFTRKEFVAGTVIYNRGDPPDGFYLLESGEMCADYETPRVRFQEPIVAGTTCGELPFFSETERTATVTAVKDCVAWLMDTENWEKLKKEEQDVSQELLRISLKLTTERMHAITNYISAIAN